MLAGGDALDEGRAVELDIEVACTGDLDGCHAGHAGEFGCKLRRNGAGSFAQPPGEFEGDGRGDLSEGETRRLLRWDAGNGDVVLRVEHLPDAIEQCLFQGAVHRFLMRMLFASVRERLGKIKVCRQGGEIFAEGPAHAAALGAMHEEADAAEGGDREENEHVDKKRVDCGV